MKLIRLTISLLTEYKIGLVLQDKPEAATPMLETDLPFIYLRFHGPEGNYRGNYPDDLLFEYASYINDWIAEGKTVYCYFNNTMGDALANLNTLKQAIIETKISDV